MMKFSVIVLVYVLARYESYAGDVNSCSGSPNCPLFPNLHDGLVTLQDLQEKVESKNWIQLYYFDNIVKQSYGKCNFMWGAPDAYNIQRQLMCYNFDRKDCEDFEMKVKRKADECNRGLENNSMNSTMDGAFYSQDIDKYFWYDTCYEYNNTNQCTTRYLDLIVRKTLYLDTDDGELDLQGLPWHLIAADLKNHFNLEFTDERLKFAWKGPECGFDGQIITSGEERRGLNITFLFIILMLTRMF